MRLSLTFFKIINYYLLIISINNILIYFTYFRILPQHLKYSLNPEILLIDKIVTHITKQYSMLSTSSLSHRLMYT